MSWRERIGLVLLPMAGFVVGLSVRRPVPAQVEKRQEASRTEDVRAAATSDAKASSTTNVVAGERVVVTRWYPSGQVAERTEREAAREEKRTAAVEKKDASQFNRHVVERIVTVEVVRPLPSPKWSANALVGWDRLSARPTVFGGQVARRLLGPVEGGAWVIRTPEAWSGGLSLGLRW